ncbi:hypothetical protein [Aneurinibacillus migulanus]|uniref:SMI1/KNR4 family protein n=1 Tax=Aneurinibacillus migulanus TaxID=47500 RepID=A0A0D1W2U9_ANEMI|nr:hypothetical protein [Aneurinibacillus migulanus]KIV52745.1 hypothetical protein TS65_21605 [Aneurinibacillus migulanus]KON96111.1 hypothetical protein AF333_12075 [Aneurinibacillus migulanus]MED0896692.1 hypothetical protein [Aneurinibacillus migulanus]MED1617231.1 hypothetical protein [Aneurinibacillus migulanus]SDK43234.1 hypothetical protein SAMN04487909_15512 [Aneurinibacillus migulanus]
MINISLYQKINSNAEIKNILSNYYDFDIVEPNSHTEDFYFKANDKVTVVAQDGSGGVYALYGSGEDVDLPVVFISSEGEFGKVGRNFEEFIGIMIACPYWRDLLKFSGNGKLLEMLKSQPFLEDEVLEDFPGIDAAEKKLISLLNISVVPKPVEMLYESMFSEPQIVITSFEGEKFDSLFNSFVANDNPLWKNKFQ